jgi:hypothetical protein
VETRLLDRRAHESLRKRHGPWWHPQATTVYLRVNAGAWQLLARVRSRSISAKSMDETFEKVLGEHRHFRIVCFGRCTIVHAPADGWSCSAGGRAPAETVESALATASATVNASNTTAALAAWAM